MSNVIKLHKAKGAPNLKINDEFDQANEGLESEEEIINKKIQAEYKRGFDEGKHTAEKELRREIENKLEIEKQKFNDLLASLDSELKNYEEKFSGLVISLAVSIAKKIIHREVEIESPLLENIKSVAQKIIGASYLLIKANPGETDILKEYSNKIFTEGNFSRIKFEEDERIEKGGFLIESDIGNVDGKISSQLEEIKKALSNTAVIQ